MEDSVLETYKEQAKSQETWVVNELTEFFGVSHTTIRKRIKDGELTATTKQTDTGKRYEISGEELARNLSQSEKLQDYLEKTARPEETDPEDHGGGRPSDNLAWELYQENERKSEKIADLRSKLAECRTERKHLEKENKELKAKLEELTEPKALPEESETSFFDPTSWFST